MMKWRVAALLAVTVPATAYVVSETVVDEPGTATRSTVTLAEDGKVTRASAREGQWRLTEGDPAGASGPATSCGDDGGDDSGDDDADDGGDDEVSVVRPCPTEVGDDDDDERADDPDD